MSNESDTGTEGVSSNEGAQPEAAPQPPKMSKIDQKRRQIYLDRRNRKLKEGVPENMVDQVLAREDYERLPVEAKLQRMEGMVRGVFGQIAEDVQSLRKNDATIAEAMDVNFRALGKALNRLGIGAEEQRALMQETVDEMRAEFEAKQNQVQGAVEKQTAEQVLQTEDHQNEAPATPAETPEGATSFGG